MFFLSKLLLTECVNLDESSKRNLIDSEVSTDFTNTKNIKSVKKKHDNSNYWKIVVQDYAKKIDDSAREKDLNKEQAIRYANYLSNLYPFFT